MTPIDEAALKAGRDAVLRKLIAACQELASDLRHADLDRHAAAKMADELRSLLHRNQPVAAEQAEDSAMLDWLIDWIAREGKLSELFPDGHIRVYTKEMRREAIRAAIGRNREAGGS